MTEITMFTVFKDLPFPSPPPVLPFGTHSLTYTYTHAVTISFLSVHLSSLTCYKRAFSIESCLKHIIAITLGYYPHSYAYKTIWEVMSLH